MSRLPFFLTGFLLLFSSAATVHAIHTEKLFVEVTVDPSTPSVTFDWDTQVSGGTVQVWRRELGKFGLDPANAFTTLATVSHPTTTYTDTTVSTGQAYEYRIYRPAVSSYGMTATYVAVTVEAPLEDSKGTVLLVVDDSLLPAMENEVRLLELDLAGDGWGVQRLEFAPHGVGDHRDLKAAIVAARTANPAINALYLFGRVPMARSGLLNPDGHSPDRAHETDHYYADLDGNWTDQWLNTDADGDGGLDDENDNIPNDGKFDGNTPPTALELMTGRVDFYRMTAHRKNEREYLRDYITKSHAWRHGFRSVPYETINGSDGYLFMEHNWQHAMFGGANLTSDDLQPTLATDPKLWAVDFGNYDGTNESFYGAVENKAIFTINFGSYKQHWFRENNAMRGLMAQPDWGLSSAWGARPAWMFHHMAAGEPIGYSALRTVNNMFTKRTFDGTFQPEYNPRGDYTINDGIVSTNLLGDPTLRLHPVLPLDSLSVTGSAGTATLNWTAPTDSTRTGFHVYRATSRLGPYTRLTASPLAPGANSYTDSSRPAGDTWYQVRAIARTTAPTGTYLNQSQGVFALIRADHSANAAPVATTPATLEALSNVPVPVAFPGSDADGDSLIPVLIENPPHGMLRWHDDRAWYVSAADYTGTDSFTYRLFDGVSLSAPVTATVNVGATGAGDLLVGWEFADPASGNQDPAASVVSPVLQPVAISKGSGLSLTTNTGLNRDAYYLSSANSSTLDLNDWAGWTVTPVEGARQSLSRLTFFLAAGASSGASVPTSPFNLELRVSTDGFASHTVVPITEAPAGESLSIGYHDAGGRLYSADLSGVTALQDTASGVEFRLYVWNAGNLAFGKSADNSVQTAYDIALHGTAALVPPVADAGADSARTDGPYTIALDGTATTGALTTYAWTQLSGPAVALSGADTLTPSFPADVAGTYIFQLTATNEADSSSDTVTVTVTPGDGPPIITSTTPTTAYLQTPYTFSPDVFDPEGDAMTYQWRQTDGPTALSLTDPAALDAAFTAIQPGAYTFRFTATSNGSATSALYRFEVVSSDGLIFFEPLDDATATRLGDIPAWTDLDGDGLDATLADASSLPFAGYLREGRAALTDSQEFASREMGATATFKDHGTVYLSGFFRADTGGWGGTALVGIQLNADPTSVSNTGLVLGLTNGDTTDNVGSHSAIHAYAALGDQLNNNPVTRPAALVDTANLVNGTTYFLLAKFEVTDAANNLGKISLLVLPDGATIPASEGAVTWTVEKAGIALSGNVASTTTALDTLIIGQGNTPGTANSTNGVDDIRIGRNYLDAIPPAIPAAFTPPAYETWASGIDWQGADSGPAAIHNAAGLSNLLVFALDIEDPRNSAAALLPDLSVNTSAPDETWASFTFRQNTAASSLTFQPMKSLTLDPGSWSALVADGITVIEEVIDTDPDADGSARLLRYRWLIPAEETRAFIKLGVSE